MNAPLMTPFLFEGQSLVRAILRDGTPWFVGNDVAAILGYSRPENAVVRHCKLAEVYPLETGGQVRHLKLIPEPDVYRLIVKSHLPAAEQVERWLFEEVLPAIRRTGSYSMAPANDAKAEIAARRLLILERNAAVRMVDQIKRTHGAKAAADSLPGIYAAVGVRVNLRRAEVQPELPLQMPPANDAKKRDEDAA